MNRAAAAVIATVVLGLTANPASAKPLHNKGQRVEPRTACARIIAAGHGDCSVRVKCHRVWGPRHHHRFRICGVKP